MLQGEMRSEQGKRNSDQGLATHTTQTPCHRVLGSTLKPLAETDADVALTAQPPQKEASL